jgi:hypothetical protein
MSDTVIRVENLAKRYRIGLAEKRPDNLRQALGRLAGAPFRYLRSRLREPEPEEIIWALKDVSFEARPELVEGSSAARWWASLRRAQDRHWAKRGFVVSSMVSLSKHQPNGGENYPAENPFPHHRADGGAGAH